MTTTDPIDLTAMMQRLLQYGAGLEGVRLGIDIVHVPTLARQISGASGQRFLKTRFTASELTDCRGRTDRIAARWAAKEAVAKAVGTGFRGLTPAMIEVAKAPDGQPSIRAVGDTPWPHLAQQWIWVVSLAHDGDTAVAVAMAVSTTTPGSAPTEPTSS